MVAAWGGETEFIKELVQGGANLNLQDEVCQYSTDHSHNILYVV